jgi:hypothetical protein
VKSNSLATAVSSFRSPPTRSDLGVVPLRIPRLSHDFHGAASRLATLSSGVPRWSRVGWALPTAGRGGGLTVGAS